jgi:predicted nucleic acid-binding protein
LTDVVLDASSAIAMTFPDEHDPKREWRIIDGGHIWAPGLLRLEYLNAVVMAERKKRFAARFCEGLCEDFEDFEIAFDVAFEFSNVMTLARRHRLTAYDAAYLELAVRRRLPLLTRDTALAAAALAEGVAP